MLSNDVTAGELVDALLLTPKSRLIAPLRVWRRGPEDFLLLTEPELGEVVRATLLRSRFAAKCEIELEEHTSTLVFGEAEGLPGELPGTVEVLDAERRADARGRRARARADRGGRARLGQGARRLDPPGRGGPRRDAHLVHEGLLPGPGADRAPAPPRQGEPAAAGARGRVAQPGDEIVSEGKAVGRVTSAVPGVALGYVRVEVPDDAELSIDGEPARLH